MTDQDVVLISGGAAGIGRTIASAFLDRGSAVHVFDASKRHIDEFLATYASATATLANIANPDDVDTVFSELRGHYGRLTVLVNNAGVAGPTAPVEDTPIEEWAQCINVDLNGFFYVTRRAVPLLKEQPNSSIVNIASTAAAARLSTALSVCGKQVGTDRSDQNLGDGARPAWHPGQCNQSG